MYLLQQNLKIAKTVHLSYVFACVLSSTQRPYGLQPTRLLCPQNFLGKNTVVGCHVLLQGIFPTQGSNSHLLCLLHWRVSSLSLAPPGKYLLDQSNSGCKWMLLLLLLLSHFSRVRLCVTPQTAAHQAPPSLGFSRQEHWSGLPFPSPKHDSEKLKDFHLRSGTRQGCPVSSLLFNIVMEVVAINKEKK